MRSTPRRTSGKPAPSGISTIPAERSPRPIDQAIDRVADRERPRPVTLAVLPTARLGDDSHITIEGGGQVAMLVADQAQGAWQPIVLPADSTWELRSVKRLWKP